MDRITTTIPEPRRIPIGKLVVGVVLLGAGLAAFLDTADIWDSSSLWSYWPLLLLALGAAGEIDAIRQRRRDGSYIVLAIGVWMCADTFGFFGLSRGETFPLAVVVAGLCLILHALIDAPPQNKEIEHERQ